MQPINKEEEKQIMKRLKEQYGINEIPGIVLKFGEEKLRLYTGSLTEKQLEYIERGIRIENIGLYILKYEGDDLRLTIDGVQFFKNQITKNIFELNDKQALEWLRGSDLDIQAERAWVVLKHKNEFIGCGKSTSQKISNFVPKERRIRTN